MNTFLSPEQQRAAFIDDAPVCILAGAGSGKTRVITHRIAYLVQEKGVLPESILGVTFTNKAAKEMRERVERLLPGVGNRVTLGTFHGIAARLLRRYGELVSVPRDFIIYDEDDCTRLLKGIIQERYELSRDELQTEIKKVLRFREHGERAFESDRYSGKVNDLTHHFFAQYQSRLSQAGAIDFVGLLYKWQALLSNEQGRRILVNAYGHLLVDEYQDINDVQSNIVLTMAKGAKTVAIVGDDDQSIYGWRGAKAQYMQTFLHTFPSAQLFRLEDNYRSTHEIVTAANALIEHNQDRLGKKLRSKIGSGALIGLKRCQKEWHEANVVKDLVMQEFERFGTAYHVAILMRTNAQSRPFEEVFHRGRIPYRMVGGIRFYDRKEIKDVTSALRLSLHPNSDVDLLRILQALPLGIGKKTEERLIAFATQSSLSLYEVLAKKENLEKAQLPKRAQASAQRLVEIIGSVRAEIVVTDRSQAGLKYALPADEALIFVIRQFGFLEELQKKDDEEAISRVENIEQLVQAAVQFVEGAREMGDACDAEAFLENVSLVSRDELVGEGTKRAMGTVTMMTLHAAKGLEFDCVFLVGMEDGILPHQRALKGFDEAEHTSAIEEERRLFYVGVTRAKKKLILTQCQERFFQGKGTQCIPSRFIPDIPEECIEPGDRWLHRQLVRTPKMASLEVEPFCQDFSQVFPVQRDVCLKVGMRVFHSRYAQGSILSLQGEGKMERARVRFDADGEVRVMMTSHLQLP